MDVLSHHGYTCGIRFLFQEELRLICQQVFRGLNQVTILEPTAGFLSCVQEAAIMYVCVITILSPSAREDQHLLVPN